MFFRQRKRRPQNDPNASLVNWIIIGFVILGILSSFGKDRQFPKEASPTTLKENLLNAAPKAPMEIGSYKNILSPDTASATMKMQDSVEGEGKPVVCGQKVSIAYEALLGDEKPIADTASKEKPLNFRIGGSAVMPALELGVVGMKKGGVRTLFAPMHMAYGLKEHARDDVPADSNVQFKITLLDVSPELPEMNDSVFRMITVQRGVGKLILCGQPTKIHITVWGVDGKKLFTTHDEGKEPITFTPGKSEVMLGLEQGVVGMSASGARTLIVPPAFQQTMNGNPASTDIPLPENQIVIVDVETLP